MWLEMYIPKLLEEVSKQSRGFVPKNDSVWENDWTNLKSVSLKTKKLQGDSEIFFQISVRAP